MSAADSIITTPVSAPVAPSRGQLRPVGADAVRLISGFWHQRQLANSTATLPHCLAELERVGWLDNFRAAAGGHSASHGPVFSDSEVYKTLEALAWVHISAPTPAHDEAMHQLSQLVIATQRPDGYLSTHFGAAGGPPRYSDLVWGHELYCAGHFLQAAVAQARTGASDELTQPALRLADHLVDEFGTPDDPRFCGHPEVELGLVELARMTGQERYLVLARSFITRRGLRTMSSGNFGFDYFQDAAPVGGNEPLAGHVVRALYLLSAAVDVAVETGDDSLLQGVRTAFDRALATQTHITGGMGVDQGRESFGAPFDLPPDHAYCETCGAIAALQLAWRLLLATGAPYYADFIERVAYNMVAGAVAPDGAAFFYANPLHQLDPAQADAGYDPTAFPWPSPNATSRKSWYSVSCCATNLARTLASLNAYVATTTPDAVQLHLYASCGICVQLAAGTVELSVHTDYPADGSISIEVLRCPAGPWRLELRIPVWADAGWRVTGADIVAQPTAKRPILVMAPQAGQRIELQLPMEPRWTVAAPGVDALRGCVAVERGPLVLCAEQPASSGIDLHLVAVDTSQPPSAPASGKTTLSAGVGTAASQSFLPLDSAGLSRSELTELPLIPFANRALAGTSAFRVWLPACPAAADAPNANVPTQSANRTDNQQGSES